MSEFDELGYLLKCSIEFIPRGVVVQLVRIPACHAGGRGFEPRPLRQNSKAPKPSGFGAFSLSIQETRPRAGAGAVPASSLPPLPWVWGAALGVWRCSVGADLGASAAPRLPLTTSRASLTTSLACAGRPAYEAPLFKLGLTRYRRWVEAHGLGRYPADVVLANFEQHLDALAGRLERNTWLCGDDPSIADIAVAAQLEEVLATSRHASLIRARGELVTWLARCEFGARDARAA